MPRRVRCLPVIPQLVSAYLERALPGDRPLPRQVRIAQQGQMWLKPGASPRRFTVGEAMRYLAELPLVPFAMARNAERRP